MKAGGPHEMLLTGDGARVTVRTGSLTQTREMKAGGSYASSNDFRSHFGLGAADVADEVVVKWSSGKTTRLTEIKAGQVLTVRE